MTTFSEGSLVRVTVCDDMRLPVHLDYRIKPKVTISVEGHIGKVVWSDDYETEVEFELGFIKLRCRFPNRDLTPAVTAEG